MGTVHAVSMKYAAMASVSGVAAYYLLLSSSSGPGDPFEADMSGASESWGLRSALLLPVCCYLCLLNGLVSLLFNLERGMHLLGKAASTGSVPAWSYVLFFGFHLPTWVYTTLRHRQDQLRHIPAATEVAEGWWVGGRYAAALGRRWAGVVDLTCEFPEGCRAAADQYLLLPCWDGVPPSPHMLQRASHFAVQSRARGDVLIHCAHGRGRSTTAMCAALVQAGLHDTWEKAFFAIQEKRGVVSLNRRMREALAVWQNEFYGASWKPQGAPGEDTQPAAESGTCARRITGALRAKET